MSRTLYSQRAVLASAYKLSGRWPILVDDGSSTHWMLFVLGGSECGLVEAQQALARELVDQALRERLDHETRELRTLIVAQAFAEGNLLDPTRDDESSDLDPRGTGTHR